MDDKEQNNATRSIGGDEESTIYVVDVDERSVIVYSLLPPIWRCRDDAIPSYELRGSGVMDLLITSGRIHNSAAKESRITGSRRYGSNSSCGFEQTFLVKHVLRHHGYREK
jgi:hypothetical protein